MSWRLWCSCTYFTWFCTEVHGLGRCLICQEVGCGPGGVGLQAQGGADRIARANWKGDLRSGVDPNQARDVLGNIDRHFHVDVKETKAEEGMEGGSETAPASGCG